MKKLLKVLMLTLATNAWAGDLEEGVNAYGKGDFKAALTLLQTLAETGNAVAQSYIGPMYSHGEGVAQDDEEAVHWHKLAAKQGNVSSQYALGVRFYSGKGVIQNYEQAHMWVNLAAVSGNYWAKQAREAFAKQMTPRQIENAQAMAKKCLASKYKDCD